VQTDREDDSGQPFVDLSISSDGAFLSLVQLQQGTETQASHVIFYAKSLRMASRARVNVERPTVNSGGNPFFRFKDLEPNTIEVCVEP
jgi:hypothetical protein